MVFSTAYPRIRVSAYPLNNIPRSLLGEEWYFPLRIRESTSQHTISLLGEGWYFRLRIRVSSLFRGAASKWQGILQLLRNMLSISGAYLDTSLHFTIYLEVYLGRGGIFDCVSAYPRIHFTIYLEVYLGRSGIFDCICAYPRIHFTIYQEVYLGRSGICHCVSAYPRIRVSAYPLHNILLRSLLGEEWYFRLRIRVSSLFRGAASKWQGILQLLRNMLSTSGA